MKKAILILVLLLTCLALAAASGETAPSVTGQLKVTGTQLTDMAGDPVQLRGISTHGLSWFPQFVNAEAFRDLKDGFGCNVVRLAMYTGENGGYCTDGDQDALKALVREGVSLAKDADMYVIVDWHILSDNDPRANQEAAVAFFDEMSAALAGETHVLYEICNEPNSGTSWQDIHEYADAVIPVIRSHAPEAVILVGTPDWCQRITDPAADPIKDDNVMYDLHFYAASNGQNLRDAMEDALALGIPVFVSEFGICSSDGNGVYSLEQAEAWKQVMDDHQVSYVMWNLSNKDELSAVLKADCDKVSGFVWDDLTTAGQWLCGILEGSLAEGQDVPRGEARAVDDQENLTEVYGLWGSWIDRSNGASATVTREGNRSAAAVKKSGKSNWFVQIMCSGLSLEEGVTYELTFDIAATKEITFDSHLQKNYDPYTAYASLNAQTAGPDLRSYELTFTMTEPTDKNISLVFNVGANGEDYEAWVENAVLKKLN